MYVYLTEDQLRRLKDVQTIMIIIKREEEVEET